MIDIVIIGAGGTASEVLLLIEDINRASKQFNVIGLLDDYQSRGRFRYDPSYDVLGDLGMARKLDESIKFVFAISKIEVVTEKLKMIESLDLRSDRFIGLVHPRANVASSATISLGAVVHAGAFIGPNCNIMEHVTISPNVTVNQNCKVDEGSYIAAGTSIGGHTIIGKECYVGMNSSVKQGINIGNRVIIGMGSVVIKHIVHNQTVYGVPARKRLGRLNE